MEKRRARSKWQRTRYPSDKRNLNKLTKQLKKALWENRMECYANYTRSLTRDNKSLWTATKKLLSYKETAAPIRRPDNSWARSDIDKVTIFAQHLSKTFTPHEDTENDGHDRTILEGLTSPLQLSLPPASFSPIEVAMTIRKLPKKKAPGHDLISAEILINLTK